MSRSNAIKDRERDKKRRTKSSVLLPNAPNITLLQPSPCTAPYRTCNSRYYSPRQSKRYTRRVASTKAPGILKDACNSAAFHAEYRCRDVAQYNSWARADKKLPLSFPTPAYRKSTPPHWPLPEYCIDVEKGPHPRPADKGQVDQPQSIGRPHIGPSVLSRGYSRQTPADEELESIHTRQRRQLRMKLIAAVSTGIALLILMAALAAIAGGARG